MTNHIFPLAKLENDIVSWRADYKCFTNIKQCVCEHCGNGWVVPVTGDEVPFTEEIRDRDTGEVIGTHVHPVKAYVKHCEKCDKFDEAFTRDFPHM